MCNVAAGPLDRRQAVADIPADVGKDASVETSADTLLTPKRIARQRFDNAEAAVERLGLIYDTHTAFLREQFAELLASGSLSGRVRATYPEVLIQTTTFAHVDLRLSYGHVAGPGVYSTTVTRPDLFHGYLIEQLRLLLRNHSVMIEVGPSSEPIPLHFAFRDAVHVEGEIADRIATPLRDVFDVPDLAVMDDAIVNGTYQAAPGTALPLAPFTAPRIDYSLHRLPHYTATMPDFVQNFVIFTNYQFYIDEFVDRARLMMAEGGAGYDSFVEPGNVVTQAGSDRPEFGRGAGPTAANAGLSPDQARPHGADHGQYRGRAVEREDDHRSHRGVAATCLADARPLRRPPQHPGAGRLCAGPRLCARRPCARRRSADLGADPAARRGAGGDRGGGCRGDRTCRATS